MRHGEQEFIDRIRSLLASRQRKVIERPPLSHAAVLLPLFKKGESCHILFTKRTDRVKYHKGQISFPGGGVDEEDSDLEATALREAYEEIGLERKDVEILGTLDDIVTVTQFIVTPFVGHFSYPYALKTSPIEIDEVIEIPLSFLLKKECFQERKVNQGNQMRMVDSYQYGKHIIWGATARILKQFLDLISSQKKV